MSDILDKYRKAQTDQHPKVQVQEGKPYQAFEVAAHPQRRLDLRPGYDAQRIVPYSYITEIFYAGDFMIDLLFHGYPMHVVIRGKNLGELITLLREERAISISEFIPEWHQNPDSDKPIVETLTITKPEREVTEKPVKH